MEGSKIFSCEINVNSIFARMKDFSYYIGESIKTDQKVAELAAKIQASDDEDPILFDLLSNSVTIVSNTLLSNIGETSYEKTDDTIFFTIRAKYNTPDYIENQIVDYITDYIATYILINWLDIVTTDKSKVFNDSLSRIEREIKILSSRRNKPERP